MAHNPITAESEVLGIAAIVGKSSGQSGIIGFTTRDGNAGVAGACDQGNGDGLYGRSQNRHGVVGYSLTTVPGQGVGVYGESHGFNAIRGYNYGPGHAAVVGVCENHTPEAGPGVLGISDNTAVWGQSKNWAGVFGETTSTTGGAGIWGRGPLAGRFEGNVHVDGDINVVRGHDIKLSNADGAEEFEIAGAEAVDPGTVMVLGDQGVLHTSHQAYDKRVAGIVSGAGDYQPALVLDRQENGANRQPIALFGKVFCKVDAQYGAVEIGDLLTTSPTPGHAMRASDPMQAFGAVIGKALRPLSGGEGLIPVLVSLQ
jgi:hypothetical protein